MVYQLSAGKPGQFQGDYSLRNGYRITPAGQSIVTSGMVLNVVESADEKNFIAGTRARITMVSSCWMPTRLRTGLR